MNIEKHQILKAKKYFTKKIHNKHFTHFNENKTQKIQQLKHSCSTPRYAHDI